MNWSAWLPFIGGLIIFFFTWRENRKVNKVDTDGKYQIQIERLVTKNGELFESMEAMRVKHDSELDALKDKLESERMESEKIFERMNREINHLKDELRLERESGVSLRKQLDRQADDQRMVKEDVRLITGKMPLPPERRKAE